MLCINSVLAHLRRIYAIALQIDVDGGGRTGTFRAFDSLPGVAAMGAGPLQTSYGKEVPVYSPLAQGATLHVIETVVFHREPDLRGSVKCLQ